MQIKWWNKQPFSCNAFILTVLTGTTKCGEVDFATKLNKNKSTPFLAIQYVAGHKHLVYHYLGQCLMKICWISFVPIGNFASDNWKQIINAIFNLLVYKAFTSWLSCRPSHKWVKYVMGSCHPCKEERFLHEPLLLTYLNHSRVLKRNVTLVQFDNNGSKLLRSWFTGWKITPNRRSIRSIKAMLPETY